MNVLKEIEKHFRKVISFDRLRVETMTTKEVYQELEEMIAEQEAPTEQAAKRLNDDSPESKDSA